MRQNFLGVTKDSWNYRDNVNTWKCAYSFKYYTLDVDILRLTELLTSSMWTIASEETGASISTRLHFAPRAFCHAIISLGLYTENQDETSVNSFISDISFRDASNVDQAVSLRPNRVPVVWHENLTGVTFVLSSFGANSTATWQVFCWEAE
jgi:hypothetical protein